MAGRKLAVVLLSGFLMVGLAATAQAQNQGGGGGGAAAGGGGGGGGGGFGRGGGNFRQQMMDRIKEALGATDEEWQALQPKVEKVMTAQRDMRGGMQGLFGRGGGRRGGDQGGGAGGGGGANPTADTPVGKATQDLKDTLDDKSASADTISKKLAALRDAREKAKADLAAAQKDLRDVLTQRQEATLVMYGLLD